MFGRVCTAAAIVAVTIALPAPALAAEDPETVCTLDDDHLKELSGLVTTADGYVTVNDSSNKAERRYIFYLGQDCQVARTVAYPSKPTDTEDLAVAPDGTLWVGDIGDNDLDRDGIGLWELAPGASEPEYHEVRYPDGAHNAETLVLGGDGSPVIITKDAAGSKVYTFDGTSGTLQAAGSVTIPETSTSNPRDAEGRRLLTGGTNSPDGTKVAVRTYADAFEYPVTNGDVVAALTQGTPQIIPLPDEPQGESIAYSRDGTSLLTVSEADGKKDKPEILRYASKVGVPTQQSGGSIWPWIAAAAGAGAVLLALGLLAYRRVRRRPA